MMWGEGCDEEMRMIRVLHFATDASSWQALKTNEKLFSNFKFVFKLLKKVEKFKGIASLGVNIVHISMC